MTKQEIKKTIKKELYEIGIEYKNCNWREYGIDEDQAEVYNRGWYDAYRYILSMLKRDE